jgi:hypothetical protein
MWDVGNRGAANALHHSKISRVIPSRLPLSGFRAALQALQAIQSLQKSVYEKNRHV